jgi:hypothetical protein
MKRVLVACECSGTVREESLDVKPIPDFDGYLVCSEGYVLSCKTRTKHRSYYRKLNPSIDAKGYEGLTLCGPAGERLKVRIHRLVATLFLPNPEGRPCVRHLDGNPINCKVDNLAWGSHQENEEDKKRHGTYDLRRNGKLTSDDRKRAWELWENGSSQADIAAIFSVSRPTITRLFNLTTWSGMQCES